MDNYLKLEGKVVMITGSTGGVGEALVKAFAAQGCKLAISSTRQEKMDALLAKVEIAPENLLTFIVDVSDEEQIKNMVEKTIEHFGALDVQVNNAGYEGLSLPVDAQTIENMMKVYSINVFGPLYGMKYALPQMKKQKSGAIVNITSQGSITGSPTMSAYVSSKHAAFGLAK